MTYTPFPKSTFSVHLESVLKVMLESMQFKMITCAACEAGVSCLSRQACGAGPSRETSKTCILPISHHPMLPRKYSYYTLAQGLGIRGFGFRVDEGLIILLYRKCSKYIVSPYAVRYPRHTQVPRPEDTFHFW